MVDKRITLTGGSRLVLDRLKQLHSYNEQTIGSTMLVRVGKSGSTHDRVILLPNNFLLLIFEIKDETQWVMVKAVSEHWQMFTNSVYNINENSRFYSRPLRDLRQEEQEALSRLFDRIRGVYCPPTNQDEAEMGREVQEFFGENELSTAHNEAAEKYMKAKKEYEEALAKYNLDKARYEQEMKEYEAKLEKAKVEYEKYVKEMEEYNLLKQEYDVYKRKMNQYHRELARGQVQFSNLKLIYDFTTTGKIYLVDQENGRVAYELQVDSPYNSKVLKKMLRNSEGFIIARELIIGFASNRTADGFPLGPNSIVPVLSEVKLSTAVLKHYMIDESAEVEVKEPVKPDKPELIETPTSIRPEFTDEKPILERELIPLQDLKEVDYTRNLTTCPPQLAKGVFDFEKGSTDINTYIVDAPNSTGISDWMLITGGRCFKCNGWRNSWITELYTPNYPTSLRILRITEKIGSLTSNVKTPDRDQILSNTYRAFDLALKGQILNNELSYLGKDGFTYQKSEGVSVLNLKGQEVVFVNGSLPATSYLRFDEWQKLFGRYRLELKDLRMDDAVLHELFEDVAEGRHHWLEYYRQTPLAFLAKYCQINVSN
jgi:hypothetical protein